MWANTDTLYLLFTHNFFHFYQTVCTSSLLNSLKITILWNWPLWWSMIWFSGIDVFDRKTDDKYVSHKWSMLPARSHVSFHSIFSHNRKIPFKRCRPNKTKLVQKNTQRLTDLPFQIKSAKWDQLCGATDGQQLRQKDTKGAWIAKWRIMIGSSKPSKAMLLYIHSTSMIISPIFSDEYKAQRKFLFILYFQTGRCSILLLYIENQCVVPCFMQTFLIYCFMYLFCIILRSDNLLKFTKVSVWNTNKTFHWWHYQLKNFVTVHVWGWVAEWARTQVKLQNERIY